MYDGGDGCGRNSTWPVCSKPEGNSPYGLCDMAGNVCEWVNDWYGKNYYASSPSSNPAGPSSGEQRVLRGGSLMAPGPEFLRASHREGYYPGLSSGDVGFRCVRPVSK